MRGVNVGKTRIFVCLVLSHEVEACCAVPVETSGDWV